MSRAGSSASSLSHTPFSAEEKLKTAAELLRTAHHAVALTGAGISTPSGIPDFRSSTSGLWQNVDQQEVASIFGFRRDPSKFFAWMRPLAQRLVEAQPNPAHLSLARLEEMGIIKWLITQNIDMLHTRAGSKAISELHGHLRESTCVECFRVVPTADILDNYLQTGDIPRCPACGGVLKPNVILYGEQLPVQVLHEAQRQARICDVMLIVGSSLSIVPAADLPVMALAQGAQLIIINYEGTFVDSDASVVIHDDVATVLPRLVHLLESDKLL